MVIITNSINATMYYTESQWLDADGANFGENAWGFRVPNSTDTRSILGSPPLIDPTTGEVTPAVPPMTQQQVENISTAVIFSPVK